MKNIEEVREELSDVVDKLKSGELKPSVATELNNALGKITNSLKVELEYYKLRKQEEEPV